jgi:dynamin-like GTPase MGM1, mitochondrial
MVQAVQAASAPHYYRKVNVQFRNLELISISCADLAFNAGREAIFLRDRASILQMRLAAIRSRQCATKNNKYACPEVFLDVVADKLTSTAVLFLNVELLSEFYYNFPRELDVRLGRGLSEAEVERLAREDPKIRRHLEVVRRKEKLELVLEKIEGMRELESHSRKMQGGGNGEKLPGAAAKERSKRWSIF